MRKLFIFLMAATAATMIFAQIGADTPIGKLRYAEAAINKLYVDTIDEDKLVEWAIIGMLKELDPHSSYTNAEETRELNEPLEGNFSGIGITYNLINDTVYVSNVLGGGPAEKGGMLPGDRIITVNDSSIAGQQFKTSAISKRLRGPKGTEVKLEVLRGSDMIPFRLVRDDIPHYSIDAAYMADPTTGYISISRFAENTPAEFREALLKLRKKGMQNLIIDLCDNGGGYLGASIDLLGELLEPGSLGVFTEGLNSPRRNYPVSPLGADPLFDSGRLVVLVNQYSASASEITSGALQEWDRAVIVGRRTFGKGLVQRPIPFPDGSMMRLTTSHYYTPTGRNIQKPYVKGDEDAYREDIANRFAHGELMHADSVKLDTTKVFHTLRNGRTVYGGGGIMPDHFVPLDTLENTKYLRSISAKMVINNAAIEYVDAHRKELKKLYKTDDLYVQNFTVPQSLLDRVKALGDAAGVEFKAEEWDRSLPRLKMLLKGLIGRNVYESQTYDKVYNQTNPIFLEALRIINSDEYDRYLGD